MSHFYKRWKAFSDNTELAKMSLKKGASFMVLGIMIYCWGVWAVHIASKRMRKNILLYRFLPQLKGQSSSRNVLRRVLQDFYNISIRKHHHMIICENYSYLCLVIIKSYLSWKHSYYAQILRKIFSDDS